MGIGDEIMAAGRAEKEALKLGGPVRIVDREFATRWHEIWAGNPAITTDESRPSIQDGPGRRPYIAYPFTHHGHGYTGHRARDCRGRIYLTKEELAFGETVYRGGRFILVEPHTKDGSNPNKRWPWDRWVALMSILVGRRRVVQTGLPGTKVLPGAIFAPTARFRDAVGVLAYADALVASEGGMHHAAAALYRPAVVIFGGSPSEQATGYDGHANLGGNDPCGRWSACEHCQRAMDQITPGVVFGALEALLK